MREMNMISENQNIILLIVSSIIFMLVFAVSIISLAIATEDGKKEPRNKYPDFEGKAEIDKKEYNFVTCPNSIYIYPEGTSCDGLPPEDYNDDDDDADNHDSDDDDDVTEDEEKAMRDND